MTPARSAEWALLAGNFAIGCGVMVVPGAMNDIVRSLEISVAAGGQLVTVAAATMALGAPLLAFAVGTRDRRALLTLALLWYAAGHALSALAPSHALLTPVRAACMLGAALFTPQAAAAVGWLAPPDGVGGLRLDGGGAGVVAVGRAQDEARMSRRPAVPAARKGLLRSQAARTAARSAKVSQ